MAKSNTTFKDDFYQDRMEQIECFAECLCVSFVEEMAKNGFEDHWIGQLADWFLHLAHPSGSKSWRYENHAGADMIHGT